MASRGPVDLPALEAWRAEHLRFTGFLEIGTKVDHRSWWPDVVGIPPDSINVQPRAGIFNEHGTLSPGRSLSLQVQPERIDWVLGPADDAEVVFGDSNSIGILPEVAEAFFGGVVRRWLPNCPPVIRLAVAGVLRLPVANHEGGYLQLSQYLHAVRIDPSTSDFSYQINRRRPSQTSVDGLQINRLMKWSVARSQKMRISVGGGAPLVTHATDPGFACRLEFDINTVPWSPGELPAERVPDIVEELIRFALELPQAGDVP